MKLTIGCLQGQQQPPYTFSIVRTRHPRSAKISNRLSHFLFRFQNRSSCASRLSLRQETSRARFELQTNLSTYIESQIDLGIFTSNDKPSCAARIWPVTNRNGSFQELDRRGFANGLGVPLWQVGFAPDAFDQQGLYLAEDGSLYTMQATNRRKAIDGLTYEIWTDTKGQERLRLEAYSST
jgi:hypothetical protein